MVQYGMDKFLLLVSIIAMVRYTEPSMYCSTLILPHIMFSRQRSWQKAPLVGTESARFSRKYFSTAAVVLGAISSAYAYFHSPFTQLCDCTEDESCTLSGNVYENVLLLNGTIISIETEPNQAIKFCNQQINPFPPVPDRQGPDTWMTEGQEPLSRIYGWFCLVLLVTYLFVIWWSQIVKFVMSCWRGMYKVMCIKRILCRC